MSTLCLKTRAKPIISLIRNFFCFFLIWTSWPYLCLLRLFSCSFILVFLIVFKDFFPTLGPNFVSFRQDFLFFIRKFIVLLGKFVNILKSMWEYIVLWNLQLLRLMADLWRIFLPYIWLYVCRQAANWKGPLYFLACSRILDNCELYGYVFLWFLELGNVVLGLSYLHIVVFNLVFF